MKKLFAIVLASAPAVVFAHPGHGNDNPLSPDHYLGNPEHTIPLTLLIAVGVLGLNWGVSVLAKRLSRRKVVK